MQTYRKAGQPISAQLQAQLFYARKRNRKRSEATAGGPVKHSGMRFQNDLLGVKVKVQLTLV